MSNASLSILYRCFALFCLCAAYHTPLLAAEADAATFSLPPVESGDSTDNASLSQQQTVYVERIRIRGSTVLSEQELHTVTAPYVGRQVTMTELQQLRQAITQLYLDKGYITSGAVIPDQKIDEGEVTLIAVEGQLTKITVQGNDQLDTGFVLSRFAVEDGKPINLAQIQEQLVLLKQNPLIDKVDAELIPGDKRGVSTLALQLQEDKPYEVQLAANNARNPSIGAEQAELIASYHSLTGWGDTTTLRFQKTEGLNEGAIYLSLPVASSLEVFAGYQQGDTDVIERSFNEIDVESEYYDALLGMRYTPIKRLLKTFSIALSLQKRESETFLLGEPFSFSPGVEDGLSKVSLARLSFVWLQHLGQHSYSLGGTLSRGLDWWDATINSQAPDGRFTSFLGQLQYAYRLAQTHDEILYRLDVKATSDALLPLEKLSIGGGQSVRGYRENTLVVDQGVITSLEYRHSALRNDPTWGNLRIAVFADYGIADNKQPPAPQPKHLSSAGLGLIWDPTDYFNATLYAAKAFVSIDNEDYDWQDSGVHFDLRFRFP